MYADYLDEHGNHEHAEFLRLEARRGPSRNTEPAWHAAEERLKELRAALNPNWVAVFDRPPIENCDPAFLFKCPKRWEQLRVLDHPDVRRCDACGQNVHFCHTLADARDHARRGDCVAVRLDVPRRPGDLDPSGAADYELLFDGAVRVTMGIMYRTEPEPEPSAPRRPWWKFW